MKLGILSDLHLEMRPKSFVLELVEKINTCEADKIVFAGDIDVSFPRRDMFFSLIIKPFFYVLGNHDFWNATGYFDDFQDEDGIVGACLWTNFNRDPLCEYDASRYINDFRVIPGWNIEKCKEVFASQKKRIFESKSDIVVTHFPPTWAMQNPGYLGDPLNGYFMNDLDREIAFSTKKLWIYGHNHYNGDMMLGNCRVVSNQLGYPNEIKQDFQIKIIEVA